MMDRRKNNLSIIIKIVMVVVVLLSISFCTVSSVSASELEDTTLEVTDDKDDNLTIGISAGDGSDMASVLQILLVLTVLLVLLRF